MSADSDMEYSDNDCEYDDYYNSGKFTKQLFLFTYAFISKHSTITMKLNKKTELYDICMADNFWFALGIYWCYKNTIEGVF